MLVYIEPYASSTCELVTEMFEYQPQNVANINKFEATTMLAGITVDTQSFSMRTGRERLTQLVIYVQLGLMLDGSTLVKRKCR